MSEALVDNVIEDIQLAIKLFNEDRVTEAYYLLKNIEQFTETLDSAVQSRIYHELDTSEDVQDIRTEGGRVATLLSLFEESKGWNIWNSGVGVNKDVTVCIHEDEELGQFFFKVEGRVHCEMKYVLASLLELELYKQWMPLCTSASCIAGLSAYRRVVRAQFDFALLQKESVYTTHGDILPGGGVLVTINPLSEHEEQMNEIKFKAAQRLYDLPPLPERSERMDMTGGFLLQEEEVDILPPVLNEIKKQQRRALRQARARYRSSTNLTAGAGAGAGAGAASDTPSEVSGVGVSGGVGGIGSVGDPGGGSSSSKNRLDSQLPQVSELALERMAIMNRRAGQSAVAANGTTSVRSLHELEKYNAPLHELYGVPESALGNIPLQFGRTISMASMTSTPDGNRDGSTPMADQTNPLLAAINQAKQKKKVTFVRGIFQIDPKLSFLPDWIFNTATRSAVSMLVPMLEHQSKLFLDGGLFKERIIQNKPLYDEIAGRIGEAAEKAAAAAALDGEEDDDDDDGRFADEQKR